MLSKTRGPPSSFRSAACTPSALAASRACARLLSAHASPWKTRLPPQERPGPEHPLACRGAIGYNAYTNGRLALLCLDCVCGQTRRTAVRSHGRLFPFQGPTRPFLGKSQAQGQNRQDEHSRRDEQPGKLLHGNPPLPLQGLGGRRPRSHTV